MPTFFMNNILNTIGPTVCACPILVICPITPFVTDPITEMGVVHTARPYRLSSCKIQTEVLLRSAKIASDHEQNWALNEDIT